MDKSIFRCSVVIPAGPDTAALETTLASVLRHQSEQTEIILAHHAAFVDRYELGDEIQTVLSRSNNLAAMINAALGIASGEIIALIRPGIEIPDSFIADLNAAFSDPQLVSAAPEFAKSAGAIHPATAFRRSVFEKIGHLDESIRDACFDLDLASTLQGIGATHGFLKCDVATSDQLVNNGPGKLTSGVDDQRMINRHQRRPGWSTAKAVAIELLTSPIAPWRLWQAIQRLGGLWYLGRDRDFRTRIQELSGTEISQLSATNPSIKLHSADPNIVAVDPVDTDLRRVA